MAYILVCHALDHLRLCLPQHRRMQYVRSALNLQQQHLLLPTATSTTIIADLLLLGSEKV